MSKRKTGKRRRLKVSAKTLDMRLAIEGLKFLQAGAILDACICAARNPEDGFDLKSAASALLAAYQLLNAGVTAINQITDEVANLERRVRAVGAARRDEDSKIIPFPKSPKR
jgi:hypothetical protein